MPVDKEKFAQRIFGDTKPQCCVCCKRLVEESSFVDALSLKEWGITRMCQKCQDGTFAILNMDQDIKLLAMARSEGVMTGTTLFFGEGKDIDLILIQEDVALKLPDVFLALVRGLPENDYDVVELMNYRITTLSGSEFNILIMDAERAAAFAYANAKFLEFMDQNPTEIEILKTDKQRRVAVFRTYRDQYMNTPVCIVCDGTPERDSLFCLSCNDAIKPVEDVNDPEK